MGGLFRGASRCVAAALVVVTAGCPSDSSDTSDGDAGSGLDGGNVVSDAGHGGTTDGHVTAADAGANGTTDGGLPSERDAAGNHDSSVSDAGHADSGAPAPDASMECKTFCACMAESCADKIFPRGCLSECATQTKWDLPCRQNMCGLVVDQPNNDHCTHAFGVNECLDNP